MNASGVGGGEGTVVGEVASFLFSSLFLGVGTKRENDALGS